MKHKVDEIKALEEMSELTEQFQISTGYFCTVCNITNRKILEIDTMCNISRLFLTHQSITVVFGS